MSLAAATQFVILTGFLGSGKTTLLADFLALSEAADTAVIVNEVGQIDIDGAVIAETGRSLPVALLSNGCVCCSVANDLLYTIEALVESRIEAGLPPFRRIVLECSGLSRPASVLRSLRELAPLAMSAHIVATIDAAGSPLMSGFEDAAAQLAAAHTIVLTKAERCSTEDRRAGAAMAKGVNPMALLVDTDDRQARARAAFQARDRPGPPGAHVPGLFAHPVVAHPRIEVAFAAFPQLSIWSELEEWLENLAGFCGQRLLRTKGIVEVTDIPDPLLVQSVGTLFSSPRRLLAGAASARGLVIIVRDMTLGDLRDANLGGDVALSVAAPRPAVYSKASES